jgi:arginyl-tRNA--protein-N-Asp/Glu arginylyltransferase
MDRRADPLSDADGAGSGSIVRAILPPVNSRQVAVRQKPGGMNVGAGGDKPNPEWLRREARRGRIGDGLGSPLAQFFATSALACPYVPGRAERKLIVELAGPTPADFYDSLSRAGFRRSHRFAYRPACRACNSCVPVRIAVEGFADSRSTRRVRNLNRDLVATTVAARATIEQFRLFAAYQRSRHGDSDMATMNYGDYSGMIEDTPIRTEIIEFRDASHGLVAAMLVDRLDDGVSAVYSFFDPAQPRRSLGTWSILWLVEECRRRGLPYVYLGYWIADSAKMAYKARFPALEYLIGGHWTGSPPRRRGE